MKTHLHALAFVLLASSTGCIALLDLTREQCSSDADCTVRGGAFVSLVCDTTTNLCVEPRTETDASTDPTQPEDEDGSAKCVSTKQCRDEHAGEEYVCEKTSGSCVALKSPTCPYVLENSDSDDAIVLAMFGPIQDSAPLAHPVVLAYQLALKEFSSVSGLPPGASGGRRPLVGLLCDGHPERADESVAHVLDDLHVAGAIGYFTETDTARLFQDRFVQRGTFFINPGSATPALANLPGTKQLIWHMLGPQSDLGPAYVAAVARAETYVRAKLLADPDEPIRVATLVSSSAADLSSAERFPVDLRWNGTDPITNGTWSAANPEGKYLPLSLPSLETNPKATYDVEVEAILSFRPHIIVAVTGDELGAKMLDAIESSWLARAPEQNRPFYVLGDRTGLHRISDFIANNLNREGARRRFVGVQFAAAEDRTEYNLYLARATAAFGTGANVAFVENYYDAVYWLGYGAAAAGPVDALTGADLARGVRKMLTGPTVIRPGGPSEVSNGLAALALGGEASFVGVTGAPDFDPATGIRRSVGSLYCFDVAPNKIDIVPTFDTLRYNPTTKELDPAANDFCFPDF